MISNVSPKNSGNWQNDRGSYRRISIDKEEGNSKNSNKGHHQDPQPPPPQTAIKARSNA